MTNLDAPQDRARDAASQISVQVGRLWLEAHTEGLRAGLEVAAQMLQKAIDRGRADDAMKQELPELQDTIIQLLEAHRDSMRLVALQVPDPNAEVGEADRG